MKARLALSLVAAAAASAPAFAADMPVKAPRVAPVPYVVTNYIVASNNQIILQAVGTNLDYAEQSPSDIPFLFSPGNFLPKGGFFDGEKGWTPGVGLKLSIMNNWLFENGYFSAESSYSAGHVDYTGYRLSDRGIVGPSSGSNHAEFEDFSLRFGKGFAINPNWMITPFAEYGYHRWARAVNAGETYEHQYAGGGLLLQVSPAERLVWSTSAMVGSTFASQIDIADANVSGLGLGSALTWKVGTGLDYALTQNWHVSGEASYTEFKYGASRWVPNMMSPGHSVMEPDSTSKVTTVKLGIGYSWGGAPVAAGY